MSWDAFLSHASEDKKEVADPLAEALARAGLKLWYDRIELRVGDSLRRRIDDGLTKSRYGIVILSPSFFSKDWPQRELDGLVQREVGGVKVILPVWYNVTAADVCTVSPMLADRVAARWSDGIGSVVTALVAAICGSVETPWPAPVIHSEKADYSSLVLIAPAEGKYMFVRSEAIQAADVLKLALVPGNSRERASLAGLRDNWQRHVFVAYDLTAVAGRVESVTQTRTAGKEVWNVEVTPEEPSFTMEVAFNTYSADQIAEMRARRILLNDRLAGGRRGRNDLNDNTLDIFVQGQDAPIKVKESPFPTLYRDLEGDSARFLAAARLVAALSLHLSGTIEHIFELDLEMQGQTGLAVRFEGQRRRQYVNVEPAVIRVEGVCQLR